MDKKLIAIALGSSLFWCDLSDAKTIDKQSVNKLDREILEETYVSRSLRFVGRPVGQLPNGKAMRQRAILKGKEFIWQKKIENPVAEPENYLPNMAKNKSIDDMSVLELAEKLRGVAYYNGHQYIEAKPDIAMAKRIKERHAKGKQKQGAFRGLGSSPSQGMARHSKQLKASDDQFESRVEKIHGVDDRNVMNNLSYPYRTNIVFDNTGSTAVINGSQGSGTLIGPSTAMSVAHVFWNESANTWEAPHRWAPGYDSQDADPSPYGEWYGCYWVTIPGGYVQNENSDYDYAVLDFDVGCNSVRNGVNSDEPGATVGWLGWYTASTSDIESKTGYVRGYPGLGNCGNPAVACNVRVWGDYSLSSENNVPFWWWEDHQIEHQADTTGGMSGSGFYHYADPSCAGCGYGAYVVGMHRAGTDSYNLARRLDADVSAFLKKYSSDY